MNLDHLETLAKAASDDPLVVGKYAAERFVTEGLDAFYDALSPDVVLALIAQAREAERLRADWSSTWRDDVTGAGLTRDEAIGWATAAVREVEWLREALEGLGAGYEWGMCWCITTIDDPRWAFHSPDCQRARRAALAQPTEVTEVACDICGSSDRLTVLMEPDVSLPIVGCGNPWHYILVQPSPVL